jgi:molecular chaperone DnaJ
MENLYEILGVEENATLDDIKKAYRKKAKELHPDKGGDEEAFKKISSAYDILSDQNKRSNYDNQRKFGNLNNFSFDGFGGNFGFHQDVFNHFFGNRRSQKRNFIKGESLSLSLNIELEDAYFGSIKKIKYKREQKCNSCNGSGALNGSSFEVCSGCNGSGQKITSTQTFFGGFGQIVSVCNECNGSGKKIKEQCNSCNGNAVFAVEEILDIQIPQGISSGMNFSLPGKGNFSKGSDVPGDLIINIIINSNKKFIRVNNDLHYDLFVSIADSIIGSDSIIVPLIDGNNVKISLDEGTEPGKTLRIQGKGMPVLNENRFGDYYVHVNIYIPKKIDDDTRKIIEKLKNKKELNPPDKHNQTGIFNRTINFKNLFT